MGTMGSFISASYSAPCNKSVLVQTEFTFKTIKTSLIMKQRETERLLKRLKAHMLYAVWDATCFRSCSESHFSPTQKLYFNVM